MKQLKTPLEIAEYIAENKLCDGVSCSGHSYPNKGISCPFLKKCMSVGRYEFLQSQYYIKYIENHKQEKQSTEQIEEKFYDEMAAYVEDYYKITKEHSRRITHDYLCQFKEIEGKLLTTYVEENDKLKEENEKLKDALKSIYETISETNVMEE